MRIVQPLPQTGRKIRRPAHRFQIRARPYVIQPFMIAPVLPGETMEKAMFQSRAVTDPIDNPLIGWWLEHYLFYVPFSALPHADDMKELMITEGASMPNVPTAAFVACYHKNGPNFVLECLQAVTETFFRPAEVAWNAAGTTVSQGGETMPIAGLKAGDSWLDSVIDVTTIPTGDGAVVDEETGLYDQLDERRLMYERIKQLGMTSATYEDWLRMNGVETPSAEAKVPRPELLRESSQWTYPTNTIDPATGTPSSACSWVVAESADKKRFFKEPGFIFGVTIARPKVYLGRQYGNVASLFNSALNWLPGMAHEAAASIIEVTKTTGPLGSGVADATSPSQNYVVDLRDLLLYGDQFINFALTATDAGLVALPTAAMVRNYVPDASIQALFKGATEATGLVRQDGICSLHVAGKQTDQTVVHRTV